MCIRDRDLRIYGKSYFTGNSAGGSGGAIYMYNGDEFGSSDYAGYQKIDLKNDAVFENNVATRGNGGAIFMDNRVNSNAGYQQITITGAAIFDTNSAGDDGGAIYMRSYADHGSTGAQSIDITGDATFTDNTANGDGGAIYMRSYADTVSYTHLTLPTIYSV